MPSAKTSGGGLRGAKPSMFAAGALTAALVVGALTDRPSDGPGSVPQVAVPDVCMMAYVEPAAPPAHEAARPNDFTDCTPKGQGGGLEVVDGKLTVPRQLRGKVVNCDCANTEAPNIGGAAVRQCLGQERNLMSLAGQDELAFEVEDDKLKTGDFCDFVSAGPGAWPYEGASVTPPNPGPDPPQCADPPDPNERCLPG